eukprot:TRINITY_DN35709_c0_g1_i1.p1 TRINITY_DN35709_c0_g1~~TRINITY_DN35709_c0_g1_i1.p1  ORF type:complete len:912 (+),score=250.86 TRINITY_DN35709_c0_g1_i1:96-2831(+)
MVVLGGRKGGGTPPLPTGAAVFRKHSGAGLSEDQAATRIQSVWRGTLQRKRMRPRRAPGLARDLFTRQHTPDTGAPLAEMKDCGDDSINPRWKAVLGAKSTATAIRKGLSLDRADTSAFMLDDRNIDVLRRGFEEADVREAGTLNIFEFAVLWQAVFSDLRPNEVERIIEHIWTDIDEDEDDEITFEELVTYLKGVAQDDNEVDAMLGLEGLLDRPETARQWVWAIVDQTQGAKYEMASIRNGAMVFTLGVQFTILVSIVTMIVETLPELADADGITRDDVLGNIERVCIMIFTVEFLLRLMSTPRQATFWTSTFTWIDLLAIMPYYLTVAGVQDESSSSNSLVILRVLRMARLVRVLRVLKLGRNSEGIQLMAMALHRSRLALTWALALVGMAVVLFASLMYYVEKEDAVFHPEWRVTPGAPPEQTWVRPEDSPYRGAGKPIFFQSIPDAMWWALVTLTTVGFGDVYPVTPLGKTVGSISMITGLLVIAYPVTIISTAFTELQTEFAERKKKEKRRDRFKQRWKKAKQQQHGVAASPPGSPKIPDLTSIMSGLTTGTPKGGLSRKKSKKSAFVTTVKVAKHLKALSKKTSSTDQSRDGVEPKMRVDSGSSPDVEASPPQLRSPSPIPPHLFMLEKSPTVGNLQTATPTDEGLVPESVAAKVTDLAKSIEEFTELVEEAEQLVRAYKEQMGVLEQLWSATSCGHVSAFGRSELSFQEWTRTVSDPTPCSFPSPLVPPSVMTPEQDLQRHPRPPVAPPQHQLPPLQPPPASQFPVVLPPFPAPTQPLRHVQEQRGGARDWVRVPTADSRDWGSRAQSVDSHGVGEWGRSHSTGTDRQLVGPDVPRRRRNRSGTDSTPPTTPQKQPATPRDDHRAAPCAAAAAEAGRLNSRAPPFGPPAPELPLLTGPRWRQV